MGKSKDEKDMKKVVILAILGLVMCGCVRDSGEPVATDNPQASEYSPKFLFNVDGVNVYKFNDGGRTIYFTNTNGRCEYEYTTHHSRYINGRHYTTHRTHHVETICNSDSVE